MQNVSPYFPAIKKDGFVRINLDQVVLVKSHLKIPQALLCLFRIIEDL